MKWNTKPEPNIIWNLYFLLYVENWIKSNTISYDSLNILNEYGAHIYFTKCPLSVFLSFWSYFCRYVKIFKHSHARQDNTKPLLITKVGFVDTKCQTWVTPIFLINNIKWKCGLECNINQRELYDFYLNSSFIHHYFAK